MCVQCSESSVRTTGPGSVTPNWRWRLISAHVLNCRVYENAQQQRQCMKGNNKTWLTIGQIHAFISFYLRALWLGREPWSSGYGRRITFQRSRVWIPAPDIGWTWHFFTLICYKNCIVCLKKTENKQKRGRGWPIFLKRAPWLSYSGAPQVYMLDEEDKLTIRCVIIHLKSSTIKKTKKCNPKMWSITSGKRLLGLRHHPFREMAVTRRRELSSWQLVCTAVATWMCN